MEITFRDEKNKTLFYGVMHKMGIDPEYDPERAALAYLITMDDVCREHIADIYNFDQNCIRLNCFRKGWQTSTSRRTITLAFNLYNSYSTKSNSADVLTIFSGGYQKYYVQALRIRFPHCGW